MTATLPQDDDSGLTWATAVGIAGMVRAGHVSAREVAAHFVERVARLDPGLNAFVHHDPGRVLARAGEIDAVIAAGGDPGPLAGVPYSLKESTAAAGLPCTGGLRPLEGTLAPRDSAVARRLAVAGGVLLGKTNLPESGYWGGTDNHLYGPTRNPWDPSCSPGGSTGGGAAAVAAGLGPLADGSDGAGSIRIPAAMCGVFGFKPSSGRIPQEFMPDRHVTFISHGVLSRSVADAALMLSVEAGPDPADPLSLPCDGTDYAGAAVAGDLRGWRIAWSPDLGIGEVATDPEVLALCRRAVEAFATLGATVVEAAPDWPDPEQAMWSGCWLPAYAPDHGYLDWDALEGEVDEHLVEIIRAGAASTGIARADADLVRGRVYRAFAAFMSEHDLLVCPTLRVAGFPVGEFGPPALAGEPLSRRLLGWVNTYPFNMTGTPAASVPVGRTSAGLPVGLHLAGGHLGDAAVLRAAAVFESVRPWAREHPPHS
ncbi:MAG: amidase [Thermoleophilia bacterium]|nr:amidase [Thermoleophilia bacterium]